LFIKLTHLLRSFIGISISQFVIYCRTSEPSGTVAAAYYREAECITVQNVYCLQFSVQLEHTS